jgi:glycosyltransferase involved in cell wall biosynthesis
MHSSQPQSHAAGRPLRIGVMLRHLGQHGGGVSVYTRNLLRELIRMQTPHELVLLHREPRFLGSFGTAPGLREVVSGAPSVLLWDQLVAPRLAARERVDLLFNPKYSVPLVAPCPSAFVCHGLDWYVMPHGSRWLDRLSHRFLIPRYARVAERILCVSDSTREHVQQYLGVPAERTETVHLGVDETFRASVPPERIAEGQRAHRLPARFFLYCGQIYPPKNFGRLLQAFARVGPSLGIHLVVAGEHRWLAEQEIAQVERLGIQNWVHRTGWIDRDTLPAFYRLAEALLLPSLYESFGLPLLEAMASGCPVVTANRYGCRELAGDAGVLVDPEDVGGIAEGMLQIASDAALREKNIAAGRLRAGEFSWSRCAQRTLAALERAAQGRTASATAP